MFMTPGKFEHPEDRDFSPGEKAFGLLRAAVAAAIDGGHFRPGDVDTVAQVLWASMHGAVALIITLHPQMWPHVPARPDLVQQVVDATHPRLPGLALRAASSSHSALRWSPSPARTSCTTGSASRSPSPASPSR